MLHCHFLLFGKQHHLPFVGLVYHIMVIHSDAIFHVIKKFKYFNLIDDDEKKWREVHEELLLFTCLIGDITMLQMDLVIANKKTHTNSHFLCIVTTHFQQDCYMPRPLGERHKRSIQAEWCPQRRVIGWPYLWREEKPILISIF